MLQYVCLLGRGGLVVVAADTYWRDSELEWA